METKRARADGAFRLWDIESMSESAADVCSLFEAAVARFPPHLGIRCRLMLAPPGTAYPWMNAMLKTALWCTREYSSGYEGLIFSPMSLVREMAHPSHLVDMQLVGLIAAPVYDGVEYALFPVSIKELWSAVKTKETEST